MNWYDIAPKDAVSINCATRPDLNPPRNEVGEICPWPWEPQQLVGAPLGQFHCPYCGAMCMAGMRHPDYTGLDEEYEEYEEYMREEEDRRLADVARGIAPMVGPYPEEESFG
jgi:hypothetical protein